MSSGSAQDVAVEHFLRDIERRGKKLHCAVIGREGGSPHGDMNLLYRKSRLDWRHRDSDSTKKSSGSKDSSATVGKVRDLASFRRHFRMGFLTMPASQDLSPRPCASAMAPRSQSCHSVGLENGDFPDRGPPPTAPASAPADRRPPAKPKRHPSTRLSSPADPRSTGSPKEAPPPPPPSQPPGQHADKRSAMNKSDSGEPLGRKVPPLKPKRSPNTQLSFDPPPPRVPPPPTPTPTPTPQPRPTPDEDAEDEPVYIEMVGQVFSRESCTATPHPATPAAASTPDSDSDQSEAIYEEMKYPLLDEAEPRARLPPKHEKPRSAKPAHPAVTPCSSSPLPHPSSSSSSSHSKPKATVSISHSSPLPSSSSSTPVPQPLSSSPQPPRAPTPFLLPGSKAQSDSSNKIPAPFPNLLQHRPPLLAFPQPAAASSGVGAQLKAGASKLATVSIQGSSSLPPPPSTTATAPSSSSSSISAGSKLPVLQLGAKESLPGGGAPTERQADRKEVLLGPAPGLRARSHSTPLPPSSQSTSSHYPHHHSHRPPSHYHHYRRPEKELPTSHSMKLGSQASAQTQTPAGGKEGKSVGFLLKSDKRDRERETGTPANAASQTTPTPTSTTGATKISTSSTPSPAPPPSSASSGSTQRSSSRPLLGHSHAPLYHALPAYRPPPSDSPLLWTYPSAGLRRPPAYDSLRAGSQAQSPQPASGGSDPAPKGSLAAPALQGKSGSLSRDGGSPDDASFWPMQRKMSFSHGSRETDKEDTQVWNGSSDTSSRADKEDRAQHSGIPVWSGGGAGSGGVASEGTGAMGRSSETRPLARSGLPLPCQTFPACHRNGELGRLGRSASTSGVRQGGGNVHRQCSLPPREALGQPPTPQAHAQPLPACTPTLSHQQLQLQLHQQQLQQQLRLQLQYQQLAQLAQCQPPTSGGATSSLGQAQRDGKLLEVIERKRCLCKEIKAHRRPDRSLCKQDSMPILPSWRRTPEPRKTGTPPCQPPAVLWDTSI